MRYIVIIAFLLYAGIAGAQTFGKRKIDTKTGDTTQLTKQRALYNPVGKHLLLGQAYSVFWRVEKLMAKGHRADTLLFNLQIFGGGYFSTAKPCPLLISFTNGRSLSLPLRSGITEQIGGISYSDGDSLIGFPDYILSPEDIKELSKEQISGIKVTTVHGLLSYPVNAKRARQVQEGFSAINVLSNSY